MSTGLYIGIEGEKLMKILITGATGLVGKELGKALVDKGHELVVVTRSKKKAFLEVPFKATFIEANLEQAPLSSTKLEGIEAVIHLAGENVGGGRWNAAMKERIYNSRIVGTRHLVQSLPSSVHTFISASATGFYGHRSDESLNESSSAGQGFLSKVCLDWEFEASRAKARTVLVRTGLVLAPAGGALDKMILPFKAGVGAILGSGRQWMSWIHIKDLVQIYLSALESEEVRGAINAVSPDPVQNAQFSRVLADELQRGLVPAVPSFVLKTVLGEMSSLVLDSQKVFPEFLLRKKFSFKFADIRAALKDCLSDRRGTSEVMYAEQFLPLPIEEVFKFFADAHNLEKITPPLLNFNIKQVSTPEVVKGTLIQYQLKVHGLPMRWLTEIADWQPPFQFVDNQLKGPYSLWHHTHSFKSVPGGTLMIDRVRYRLPLGYLGWLGGYWMVRRDVGAIFSYRRESILGFLNLKQYIN